MRRFIWSFVLLFTGGLILVPADQIDSPHEAGKKIERTACLPCHSLRIIQSQRLSSAAWTKEVDKMIGWGAVVSERQALIDYLAAEYSNSKPLPAPVMSENGVARTQP